MKRLVTRQLTNSDIHEATEEEVSLFAARKYPHRKLTEFAQTGRSAQTDSRDHEIHNHGH